jgi:hypothetical protein
LTGGLTFFSSTNEDFGSNDDFTKELLIWGGERCLDGGKGEGARL